MIVPVLPPPPVEEEQLWEDEIVPVSSAPPVSPPQTESYEITEGTTEPKITWRYGMLAHMYTDIKGEKDKAIKGVGAERTESEVEYAS